MEESILLSVKKSCGIAANYKAFDSDLILLINAALMDLGQLGFQMGVRIEDESTTWNEVVGSSVFYEGVKEYLCLKVKMAFDPPSSSFVLESYKEILRECEWRIMTQLFIMQQGGENLDRSDNE